MAITIKVKNPLFAAWDEQYARLMVPGIRVGDPIELRMDGKPTPFQYTGAEASGKAEILLRLGFSEGQVRLLEFTAAATAAGNLAEVDLSGERPDAIGFSSHPLLIAEAGHAALFSGFSGFPIESRILCDGSLEDRILRQVNDGTLFRDYIMIFQYSGKRKYQVHFRCYRREQIVEVDESFSLGMNASLELVLNPEGSFDSILSHGTNDFERDAQPSVERLDMARPRDILCRLQMPPLGEYSVPLNRGWFALFDSRNEARGMLGLIGLYGAKWMYPARNMMRVSVAGGRATLRASLESGARHWLLYAGPVEKGFRVQGSEFRGTKGTKVGVQISEVSTSASQLEDDPSAASMGFPTLNTPPSAPRFIFHRLHAEFNALRLDEHLDLTGDALYDGSCWDRPGFFGDDYRARARRNAAVLPPLRDAAQRADNMTLQSLLDPRPRTQRALADDLFARFAKWARQFQGRRTGEGDYAKNVIGFSRRLRGMLIAYELLRKDGALTEDQVGGLHSYFVFAARRILDEGRWPHSKTWLHPDHPESTRDFYTYGGEHKPDRLVWTNSLPNFQSDPMCALLHLGTLLPDHPEAAHWRRFALDDIERQLDAYCGASGAWEESINYANFTLLYFVTTFRVVKHRLGIDYFLDARLRRFAGWLTRYFGPRDLRFGVYTFPGVGNACLPQQDGQVFLAYAGELPPDDPLRHALIAVYQKTEPTLKVDEDGALLLAASAPIPDRPYPLKPLASEHMDELGVAMRCDHPSDKESYLFQKIGFWKDHYENDETSLNWYAKGVPLAMDYGTYSYDAMAAAAHNLVEIPDMDPFRRGFLADRVFSDAVDYTHCEMPVTLKLSHGRPRTWAEVDGAPRQPLFFYIGDDNPVGPKVWKTRLLLFVKPDYVLMFDKVIGDAPHRYNLHVVADDISRDGALIHCRGRFDLDLLCLAQHPTEFRFETGEFCPAPERYGAGDRNLHRQRFFRLYNENGCSYRTALFAKERGREATIEPYGVCGIKVTTPEYVDYAFVNDEAVTEAIGAARFEGRAGWIRREKSGRVLACVPDGDAISAFGARIEGRGPWIYNMDGAERAEIMGGPPRKLMVTNASAE